MKHFRKQLLSVILAATMVSGSVPVYAENTASKSSTKLAGTEETDERKTVNAESEQVPMYRVYNPNSGEHFYTASVGEKKHLVSLGWHDEGTGWTAPKNSKKPVYRLYNKHGGEHHYTLSKGEQKHLVSVGWTDEGIGWYSDEKEAVPVYRQYNPNAYANNHNYTTSVGEKKHLISLGWHDEGVGWYGVKKGQPIKDQDNSTDKAKDNEIINTQDNVKSFDMNTEEGMKDINSYYDSIVGIHNESDNGELKWAIAVKNDSPMMKYVENGSVKEGDIVYMPENDNFQVASALKYLGHSDLDDPYINLRRNVENGYDVYLNTIDFSSYNADTMEILNFQTPDDLTEVFKGDVDIETNGIDQENPIAFTYSPLADTEDNTVEESNKKNAEMPLVGKGKPKKAFFQENGVTLKADAKSASLAIDKEIYKNETSSISVNGTISLTDLDVTKGSNYKQSKSDADVENEKDIPDLIKSETGWNIDNTLTLKWQGSVNFKDAIKKINTELGTTHNDVRHICGIDFRGIDLSDSVIIGAIGFNLSTLHPLAGVRSVRASSIQTGISPVLAVFFTLDINGNINAKISSTYHYQEYTRTGVTFARKSYMPKVTPLKVGSKFEGLPNLSKLAEENRDTYRYQEENVHQQSKNKDDKPVIEYGIEGYIGTGQEGISFGFTPSPCIMIAGIIPARIKPTVSVNTKANLNGGVKWNLADGDAPIEQKGSLDLAMSLDVSLKAQARFNVGFKNGKDFDLFNEEWNIGSYNIWKKNFGIKQELSGLVGKTLSEANKELYDELQINDMRGTIDNAELVMSYTHSNSNKIDYIALDQEGGYCLFGTTPGMKLSECKEAMKKAGFSIMWPYKKSENTAPGSRYVDDWKGDYTQSPLFTNWNGDYVRIYFNEKGEATSLYGKFKTNKVKNLSNGIELSSYIGKNVKDIMEEIPNTETDNDKILLPWGDDNISFFNDTANEVCLDSDKSCTVYGINLTMKLSEAEKKLQDAGYTYTSTDEDYFGGDIHTYNNEYHSVQIWIYNDQVVQLVAN